jgi:hypothetical protein
MMWMSGGPNKATMRPNPICTPLVSAGFAKYIARTKPGMITPAQPGRGHPGQRAVGIIGTVQIRS